MKPTQPQWQRVGCWMLDAVALPEPLFISLSLQGIVLQSSSVSTSAVLQSTHYNQHVPRLEVHPELTVSDVRNA